MDHSLFIHDFFFIIFLLFWNSGHVNHVLQDLKFHPKSFFPCLVRRVFLPAKKPEDVYKTYQDDRIYVCFYFLSYPSVDVVPFSCFVCFFLMELTFPSLFFPFCFFLSSTQIRFLGFRVVQVVNPDWPIQIQDVLGVGFQNLFLPIDIPRPQFLYAGMWRVEEKTSPDHSVLTVAFPGRPWKWPVPRPAGYFPSFLPSSL